MLTRAIPLFRLNVRRLVCEREERLGYKSVDDIKKHPFFKGIDWANIRNSTCSVAQVPHVVALGLTRTLPPDSIMLRHSDAAQCADDRQP